MPKKRRRKSQTGVVRHHAAYEHKKEDARTPSQREITFLITNPEHQLIWRIQNRRPENISKGFWNSLKVLMALYEPFAKELDDEND